MARRVPMRKCRWGQSAPIHIPRGDFSSGRRAVPGFPRFSLSGQPVALLSQGGCETRAHGGTLESPRESGSVVESSST